MATGSFEESALCARRRCGGCMCLVFRPTTASTWSHCVPRQPRSGPTCAPTPGAWARSRTNACWWCVCVCVCIDRAVDVRGPRCCWIRFSYICAISTTISCLMGVPRASLPPGSPPTPLDMCIDAQWRAAPIRATRLLGCSRCAAVCRRRRRRRCRDRRLCTLRSIARSPGSRQHGPRGCAAAGRLG